MKKEQLLYGIIGMLLGIILAGAIAIGAVNSDNHSMMNTMGMDTDHSHSVQSDDHADMTMNEMTEQLKVKTGDDFDREFIEMMIAHHNGAVNMAILAESNAKHDEIKNLSKGIISAQTKEIGEMTKWQRQWGYPVVEMMHDSGH